MSYMTVTLRRGVRGGGGVREGGGDVERLDTDLEVEEVEVVPGDKIEESISIVE